MTLPAFQFLPSPRADFYQQEEQFWQQRDAKLRELAHTVSSKTTGSANAEKPAKGAGIPSQNEAGSMYGPQSSCDGSPTSVLADYQAMPPSALGLFTPPDVQDRRMFKQQLEAQKRLVELAEAREGVLQQLQCLEATKMHMAEQKLAEQARLCSDLDVRLQAACATLDVSAGSLYSLQQDIERLSSKVQHSISQQPTADQKQQLAAQCDRLLRCYTTLCNNQPQVSQWAWMAEEPCGTTEGNLNQKVAQLEAALAAEQRKKAALAEQVLQKSLELQQAKPGGPVSAEASSASEQLNEAQRQFEGAMLGLGPQPNKQHRAVQRNVKQRRAPQLSASMSAVSMLREAVNLSPDAKQAPARAPHAGAEHDSTDSETDTPTALAHSCYLEQHQLRDSAEEDWQQHQPQQGQKAGRATALMREAYKEMLLQQQSRHRTELERRQAKYQRQLHAQAKGHKEAMNQLIKAGYIKTCTEGDLKLEGPVTSQVKMLLEENAALQGNLSALRDDINNRVEYAQWQQRQAHEANLEEIYQQHAQELQAAGPAAQKLHAEEVKTLVSEAVEAKEAEHESEVARLRQLHEQQMQDCQADVQESDRRYRSLLQELKALKRRYCSDDSSNASSDGQQGFRRLELGNLLGPSHDDSPPCQGSPPPRRHPHTPLSRPRRAVASPWKANQQRLSQEVMQRNQQAVVEAPSSSVESPLTSMVNAVLSNRQRQDTNTTVLAEKDSCQQKHVQLPELLQGHASPDTSHAQHGRHSMAGTAWQAQHGRHSTNQPQTSTALSHSQDDARQLHMAYASGQQACQATTSGQGDLQPELTFSHSQAPVPEAKHCLRCGVKANGGRHDCRFHPALLQDPGPFLYSPEWHACRAAKHCIGSPGCFVRQGHYFPGHAVQATGLAEARAVGSRLDSQALHEHLEPRSRLPVPVHRG